MTTYAPTQGQALLLALIGWRESKGVYTLPPKLPPTKTASGKYQFIRTTWSAVSKATGVGTAYTDAYLAPPVDQDYNALWLLINYGPNSSFSWKASGPYPTLAECEYAIGFA